GKVLVGVGIGVFLALLLGVLVVRMRPQEAVPSFDFETASFDDGHRLTRTWKLDDATNLTGEVVLENPTGDELVVNHTEVLPSTWDVTADRISFEPAPTETIEVN